MGPLFPQWFTSRCTELPLVRILGNFFPPAFHQFLSACLIHPFKHCVKNFFHLRNA